MEGVLLIGLVIIIAFVVRNYKSRKTNDKPVGPTPEKWRPILLKKVNFYRNLDQDQKLRFEHDVQQFLNQIRIVGVQVDVTLEDRLLVASSAVIPLFGFPTWTYKYLDEVLLYPSSFDRNYVIGSSSEIITGMVGSGVMEGKMILSKPALHAGFDIANDKKNVGIHEFVHLFDKEDGVIDGLPPGFDETSFSLPWLELVREKVRGIETNQSDIDEYGATNRQEFFAVASEYFFERPYLLQKKHPKLHKALEEVFQQNMTETISKESFDPQVEIGRNSPCPCGSGKKYKHCCLE